jgi:hypothetical protein
LGYRAESSPLAYDGHRSIRCARHASRHRPWIAEGVGDSADSTRTDARQQPTDQWSRESTEPEELETRILDQDGGLDELEPRGRLAAHHLVEVERLHLDKVEGTVTKTAAENGLGLA